MKRRVFVYSLLGTLVLGVIAASVQWKDPGFYDETSLAVFYHLIGRYDKWAALVQGVFLVAALVLAPRRMVSGAVRTATEHPLLVAGVVVATLAAGSRFVYQDWPLSMDEYALRFQAKALAAGRLTGYIPPSLVDRVISDHSAGFLPASGEGLVISKYWPGFSLLLAPFERAGAPWLLNPLLFGGTLLLVYVLARTIFPSHPDAPGWALLFLIACPQAIVTSFSYYAMPGHLFLNLAFAVLLLRPTPARAVLAGLVGGLAILQHEPQPHVLFALPWLLWTWKRGGLRSLAALGLGYVPVLLLVGGTYVQVRTAILGSFAVGWGRPPTAHTSSGLAGALDMFTHYAVRPSAKIVWFRLLALVKLWLWAMPGLLVLAALGLRRIRERPVLGLFAAGFLLTFLASFFFPGNQGHGWGFRHLHYVYATLPLLAVAAIVNDREASGRETAGRLTPMALFAGTLALLSLTGCNLQRAVQVRQFMTAHLAQRPPHDPSRPGIVFVTGWGFYSLDLIENDPFLRNPIWYLRSFGVVEDRALMQRLFPGAVQVSQGLDGSSWNLPDHPRRMLRLPEPSQAPGLWQGREP
jgi:hypothetical protein